MYIRTSKGREPVDDHGTLLELARRGERAETEARERMKVLPAVSKLLRPLDARVAADLDENADASNELRFIVRAAPLTITAAYVEWALTRSALAACERAIDLVMPGSSNWSERHGPRTEPFARALAATAHVDRGFRQRDRAATIMDAGGVLGVEVARGGHGDDPPSFLIQSVLDEELIPLAKAMASMLREGEIVGRVAVDLTVVREPVPSEAQRRQDRRALPIQILRDVTAPLSNDDAAELAATWHRELQRASGITKFEGEPA